MHCRAERPMCEAGKQFPIHGTLFSAARNCGSPMGIRLIILAIDVLSCLLDHGSCRAILVGRSMQSDHLIKKVNSLIVCMYNLAAESITLWSRSIPCRLRPYRSTLVRLRPLFLMVQDWTLTEACTVRYYLNHASQIVASSSPRKAG